MVYFSIFCIDFVFRGEGTGGNFGIKIFKDLLTIDSIKISFDIGVKKVQKCC